MTVIARTRVGTADASTMATVRSTNTQPALATEINTGASSYYRVVGLHLRTVFSGAASYDTLRIGSTWPDTGNGQQTSDSFPSATPPGGVTYFAKYEFEGNAQDSSGRGLNLTTVNSPSYVSTP